MTLPISLFDISCIILISKRKKYAENEHVRKINIFWPKRLFKEKMIIILKGFLKTTCYKTKSNFSKFFYFLWLLYQCFSSFLIKAFVKCETLTRLYHQNFVICKNGENLKILIELFCQKLLMLFWPFWTICKTNFFLLLSNHDHWRRALPPFRNLWTWPWFVALFYVQFLGCCDHANYLAKTIISTKKFSLPATIFALLMYFLYGVSMIFKIK